MILMAHRAHPRIRPPILKAHVECETCGRPLFGLGTSQDPWRHYPARLPIGNPGQVLAVTGKRVGWVDSDGRNPK